MSKRKKILLMLAKGGASQTDVAASLRVSKRDVSACAKVLRERSLTCDTVSDMDSAQVDDLFPADGRSANGAYLRPDLEAMVERKKRSPKLPVKLMWIEYCEDAAAVGRLAYSYQTVCEMFSKEAERLGATRHFSHEPGAKAYIDWALPVSNGKAQSTWVHSPAFHSMCIVASGFASAHLRCRWQNAEYMYGCLPREMAASTYSFHSSVMVTPGFCISRSTQE